ncbi:MAG: hypothetical protein K1X79_04305 [Oligoflexia bacterium]|nr:hypothetical protein [Oligoflexia bacterium]
MSNQEFENELLRWVAEETEHAAANIHSALVSIKLLLIRLALKQREGEADLTLSTELSLRTFDRSNVFRALMQLQKRGFISFIGSGSKDLSVAEAQELYNRFMAGNTLGEVRLTEMGAQEIERQTRLEQLPEKRPISRRQDRA